MIRKAAFAALLASVLLISACKFTAEKASLDNVQATHDVIAKKYMKYVNDYATAQQAAGKMSKADADAFVIDEQKLLDSDQRNIAALRKSAGY